MPDPYALQNSIASADEDELVIGFIELPHYETQDDGTGGDGYFDGVAQYSLNGYVSFQTATTRRRVRTVWRDQRVRVWGDGPVRHDFCAGIEPTQVGSL